MAGRAVLFDLDNTLHDRDAGLESFVRWQHQDLGLAAHAVDEEAWWQRFRTLDAGGRVWKDRVYGVLVGEFALSVSPESLLASYEQGFSDHIVPMPGLTEALDGLRAEGWRIGVVSNGRTAFQTRTLKALGIELDAFVVSEACGFRKPDSRIFSEALRMLEARPEASWFVGDDLAADVGGALGAGLGAFWFDPLGRPRPEPSVRTIASLYELAGFLRAPE